ncbi:putative transcription factor WD40-like family [Helianthus annuus]|nr:putative transcription factor WD40-like family [Helianthus annuus]
MSFFNIQFRIWESARVCTHDLEGHNDAVTSVGIVKTIEDEDNTVVATGSKDKCETLEATCREPKDCSL